MNIDYSRDKLFDELGLKRLRESYMLESEQSPQDRFAFVCSKFGSNPDHAQRLYDYVSQHWLSLATPILSFGRTQRGLPISCFLSYLPDSSEGLVNTFAEVNWLSMMGGGVGIGVGIRAADDKSTGVMPHLKTYDAASLAYRQGKTRRGTYATYLDISHPDIMLFLDMRKPTGDQNLRTPNLHHGVNIPDSFMDIIEKCMLDPNYDDSWKLIDPASKQIKEIVSAKELWQHILELRMQTGEPYIHWIDTSNKFMPQYLKNKGLSIKQSNICTEILLPTNKDRTAVCCLSSLNVEYFDDWKDNPQFIDDVAEMLDNVLTYFIDNAPDSISRARYSAMMERSIGVGVLGFHAYLQRNHIPFESAQATGLNFKIFGHIRKQLSYANRRLATVRGEAPDTTGTGLRFSHVMAIAPNASTSIIFGNTSPSIEPFRANAYRQDTLSGFYMNKNKYLNAVLEDKCQELGLDINEVWSSIIANDGSVQHLDFLNDWTKDVYKTAMEIDQRWIIQHAADRQNFIDQGQSVNLFFRPDINIKYLHAIHFSAWKKGLKTLYYCRSEKIAKADKVANKVERKKIEEVDIKSLIEESCLACEG